MEVAILLRLVGRACIGSKKKFKRGNQKTDLNHLKIKKVGGSEPFNGPCNGKPEG